MAGKQSDKGCGTGHVWSAEEEKAIAASFKRNAARYAQMDKEDATVTQEYFDRLDLLDAGILPVGPDDPTD